MSLNPWNLPLFCCTPIFKKLGLDLPIISNFFPIWNHPSLSKSLQSLLASEIKTHLHFHELNKPFQSRFHPIAAPKMLFSKSQTPSSTWPPHHTLSTPFCYPTYKLYSTLLALHSPGTSHTSPIRAGSTQFGALGKVTSVFEFLQFSVNGSALIHSTCCLLSTCFTFIVAHVLLILFVSGSKAFGSKGNVTLQLIQHTTNYLSFN